MSAIVQIHTAGELHLAPAIEGRVTFTFNLSDLLDDPARKPDADLVQRDGTDHRMQDFVFFTDGALDLYEDMVRMISRQLERGKDVIVLILCRGGKHRSVAFGENLAGHFDVTATHHHVHLPIVVTMKGDAGPVEGQVWECRDQVGRTGEQVRIVASLELTPDEDATVAFIVSKAAKGYEAELGAGGSMETTEFTRRYRFLPGVTAIKWEDA